ncbi:MAG: dipeptidase [Chloroflexota bacterium]|nr:dipeptidase [Chloroflexota bacterium]
MSTPPPVPIIDGHNDALLRLDRTEREGRPRDFFARGADGHLDLPRAREGGLAAAFFAVYVPPGSLDGDAVRVGGPNLDVTITETGYEVPLGPPLDPGYARRATFAMVARLLRLEARSGGRFRVARTADDLEAAMRDGTLAAILHLEGAEAIDPGLDALEVLYRAGLRSLGPVWSRPNAFGHGVPFRFPASPDTGPGLTAAGRDLIRACNHLGILVDLSHLNERGFWDVADLSTAPLVATHSAAHAVCPSTRNLTDDQLRAIAASGGLVGMNFEVSSLRPDGHDDPDTPLEVLVRQVDELVARMGIGHVAFGSDFDGATMPRAIGDAAGLPRLLASPRAHGYDDRALRQLAHENWLRVLRATWRP